MKRQADNWSSKIRSMRLIQMAGAAALAFIALDQRLQIDHQKIICTQLPKEFDGLKIAHVSDLHGCAPYVLLEKLREEKPDLIFCTGDLYDGCQHSQSTRFFYEQAVKIAPLYFVDGNHEGYCKGYPAEKRWLKHLGAVDLNQQRVLIKRQNACIELCGIADPNLDPQKPLNLLKEKTRQLAEAIPPKKQFRIVLFHRASLVDCLASLQADLVLCGHLHGGQWRILNHGLIAPKEGGKYTLFPRFSAGVCRIGNQQILVSRGLGDQMKIPRLFNRPHLPVYILKRSIQSDSSSKEHRL